MNFLLIPLFFALNTSQASELDKSHFKESILPTISQINKGTLLKGSTLECNGAIEGIKKDNKELFNQCAVDLCGPPEKNVSFKVTDEQFYDSASLWKKFKINLKDSLFNEIYETAINKKLQELEKVKRYLKNPSLKNISLEGQVKLASDVFSPYIKIETNPESKKTEERIQVTTLLPHNASDELKEAVNYYAVKLRQSVLTNPKTIPVVVSLYSDEELANSIREMIAKVKKSYQENPNSLKDNPKFADDIDMMEKMFTGVPLRAYMETNLWGIISINNEMFKVTKKDVLNQVVCDIPSCKKVYEDFFDKSINKELIEKNLVLYEKFLKDPKSKVNAINRCKSNIIYKASQNSDEEKAKKSFLVAKNNVINNLLPHFSEHSRKIIADYLNNQLALNTVNLEKKESMKKFVTKANEYLEDSKKEKMKDDFDLFRRVRYLNDSFDEIDPLEDMFACDQVTYTGGDAFIGANIVEKKGTTMQIEYFKKIGNKDQLFISDFSCQNGEHGHHILAHEIAHAISNLIQKVNLSESSAALYYKARACITSNYLEVTAPNEELSIIHKDDSSHSEEDMADFLAALSTPHDKKNYMCSLLQKNFMSNSYSNLNFTVPGSNHSSPLSRIIFEAIYRDIPLPQSCQRLIEDEKPGMRFQKCEL